MKTQTTIVDYADIVYMIETHENLSSIKNHKWGVTAFKEDAFRNALKFAYRCYLKANGYTVERKFDRLNVEFDTDEHSLAEMADLALDAFAETIDEIGLLWDITYMTKHALDQITVEADEGEDLDGEPSIAVLKFVDEKGKREDFENAVREAIAKAGYVIEKGDGFEYVMSMPEDRKPRAITSDAVVEYFNAYIVEDYVADAYTR